LSAARMLQRINVPLRRLGHPGMCNVNRAPLPRESRLQRLGV
jgi:hypothetical protein